MEEFFHITQARLDGCNDGGQVEIRQQDAKSHAVYRGAIQTATLDAEGIMRLQLMWCAKADDPSSIQFSWTRCQCLPFEADLLLYRPSWIEEGMLCLQSDFDQTLTLYARNHRNNIDPATVKGLALHAT